MRLSWLPIAAVALAACSPGAPPNDAAAGDALTAVAKVSSGMAAQATTVASADPSQQFARRAQEEAARVLGVPVDQLTVERIESVQWRDASLGCAEPGRTYAQVITPGVRVVLAGSGGQKVEVHGDLSGRAVVCQNPTQ